MFQRCIQVVWSLFPLLETLLFERCHVLVASQDGIEDLSAVPTHAWLLQRDSVPVPPASLKGSMAESTLAPSDSTLNLGPSKASKDNFLTFIEELLGGHLGVIQELLRMFVWVVLLWSGGAIHGQQKDEQSGQYDYMRV